MESSRDQAAGREAAWAVVREAAADLTSGAEAITKLAAKGLSLLAKTGSERADFEAAIRELLDPNGGHPGMAPLWRMAEDCISSDDPGRQARRWEARLDQEYLKVAEEAAAIISSGPTRIVLTNSYSKTVIATMERAAQSTKVEVLCALSEPGGEGATTAAELRAIGVRSVVVEDRKIAQAISRASAMVCGADAVMPEALRNKVGTRELVEIARAAAIPRYAVAGESKFIALSLPSERLLEDVYLEAFTLVIADTGSFTPEDAAAHARTRRVPTVESLVDLSL